jgi:hypothetical protein
MPALVDKILALSESLGAAGIPHAFGGALALAYATEEPRGTRDVDVNLFVSPADAERAFRGLPDGVRWSAADVATVLRDEQVRLWWDDTPVDLFFAAHDFHRAADGRARTVDFLGRPIRVLAPVDLATFKVLFDRSKDWTDIETMRDSGTLALDEVIESVRALLGDDARVARLETLRRQARP